MEGAGGPWAGHATGAAAGESAGRASEADPLEVAETRKRRKSPEPRPGREASRPTPARGAERVPRRARSRRPGAWGPQCPATAPVDVLQEFNKTCVFALKGHLRTYKDVQFLFEQKANKIKRPRVTWKTTAAA